MKICRVEIGAGKIIYGIIQGEEVFGLEGELTRAKPGNNLGRLSELKLKCPSVPSKVVGVGLN